MPRWYWVALYSVMAVGLAYCLAIALPLLP